MPPRSRGVLQPVPGGREPLASAGDPARPHRGPGPSLFRPAKTSLAHRPLLGLSGARSWPALDPLPSRLVRFSPTDRPQPSMVLGKLGGLALHLTGFSGKE